MKVQVKIVIVLCLLIIMAAQAQQRSVATFRNITITEEEFKNRFELTPRLGASDFLIDSLKMEFLSTLLAEKLWAAEAIQLGYDTLDIIKRSLAPIEKMLVRDALYKEEVESKIIITKQEIDEITKRANTAVIAQIVGTPDSATAYKWYLSLSKGASFQSIVKQTKDTGTVKMTFGSMERRESEDIVYALPRGGYSKPVKDGKAWFIFYCIGREPYEKKKDNMTEPGSTPLDLFKQSKAAAIGKPFLAKLLKDFTVQIDKETFMAAVDAVAPVFATAKMKQLRNPNGEYCIDESDESTVLQAVPTDKIDAVLVPLPGTPVTLRQFLTETIGTGFCIKKAGKDDVMKHVRGLVHKYIEHEMIAREGYRRGLQNTRAVQDEMQMWKANYCAQFLRNRYLDSVKVTDEEVLALYDSLYKEKTSSVVKYAEIFSAGLTVMQEAVDRLGRGESFGSVAAALTERKGMREKHGLYPETLVSLTGELSQHLGEMRPGDIKGPIKTPDGYVMVQLIEKKQAKDTLGRFEQLKELLQKAAVSKKLYARMYSTTKDFARSLQPEINTRVLGEIEVSPVPMYTVRLMGFGGRMLAYPFSTHWENWIPGYLQNKETP